MTLLEVLAGFVVFSLVGALAWFLTKWALFGDFDWVLWLPARLFPITIGPGRHGISGVLASKDAEIIQGLIEKRRLGRLHMDFLAGTYPVNDLVIGQNVELRGFAGNRLCGTGTQAALIVPNPRNNRFESLFIDCRFMSVPWKDRVGITAGAEQWPLEA